MVNGPWGIPEAFLGDPQGQNYCLILRRYLSFSVCAKAMIKTVGTLAQIKLVACTTPIV